MVFDKVTPEFKSEFDKLVSAANSILITSHKSPDDDSIGCVLSTYYILTEKYPDKKIEIIYSQEINQRWSYFKNFVKIKTVDDIAYVVQNYDLIIYLDSCEYVRFSDLPDKLKANTKKSICLDHHKNPPNEFDLLMIDTNASSCCEFIYFLLAQDLGKIPPALAETLLLGILGDSGNLEFIRPPQAYIFPIVQRLVEEGNINIQEMKAHYTTIPERVFRIVQELIKNSQIKDVSGWPRFVCSYLDRNFIQNGRYTQVEVSSASHISIQTFGKSITDVPWVVYATPEENGDVSFNLRSRPGGVNVKDLMQQMGIGGGHNLAAGGTMKKTGDTDQDPLKCLEQLSKWMGNHQPTIS